MTPNILKSHTDTSKFNGQKADTPANDPNNNNYSNYNPAPKSGPSSNMPTDASNRSGQALDAGASAGNQALNAETPLHENASKQGSAPILSSAGAIGSQFTEHGAIGGTAQKIGGPLDKEGAIGKHFKGDGSLGGTVNKLVGGEQK